MSTGMVPIDFNYYKILKKMANLLSTGVDPYWNMHQGCASYAVPAKESSRLKGTLGRFTVEERQSDC